MRLILKSAIKFLLLFGAFYSCQSKLEEVKPNIIVFLVDDMGWQDTSVPFWDKKTPFNNRYRTPNMERLASLGMKFTQAYATPVCSPTRISLMTGMNAARHRVTNWTLKKNSSPDAKDDSLQFPQWNVNGMSPVAGVENTIYATPLPKLLKEEGYHTIHVGKAHFGAIDTPGENPKNLGFDVNIAGHAAGSCPDRGGTRTGRQERRFSPCPHDHRAVGRNAIRRSQPGRLARTGYRPACFPLGGRAEIPRHHA